MKATIKNLLLLLCYLIAAISLAIIITTNLSVFFVHSFDYPGITRHTLLADYRGLLAYLQVPFDSHLSFTNLPMSSNAARHFHEVHQLLIINEVVCIVSWISIVINNRYEKKRSQLMELISLIDYLCMLLVISGLLGTVNFSSSFINFHRFLFSDRTWIFNPVSDPIILAMPTSFFLELLVVGEGITILILVAFRQYNYHKLLSGKFRF